MAEGLEKIRQGFDKAVEEEVKSQKMKTELITNVSHDLKTPLTAIITYVDLLKKEEDPEKQKGICPGAGKQIPEAEGADRGSF